MKAINFKLSDKVYKKDFKVCHLGYSCEEVDTFLDEINDEISKLEREKENLENEKESLKKSIEGLKSQLRQSAIENSKMKAGNQVTSTESTGNFQNIEIIERLQNIENSVVRILDKLK